MATDELSSGTVLYFDAIPRRTNPNAEDADPAGSASSAEAVPHGTLDPERLRTLVQRLATGFYESDEVLNCIAGRVAQDLV